MEKLPLMLCFRMEVKVYIWSKRDYFFNPLRMSKIILNGYDFDPTYEDWNNNRSGETM